MTIAIEEANEWKHFLVAAVYNSRSAIVIMFHIMYNIHEFWNITLMGAFNT